MVLLLSACSATKTVVNDENCWLYVKKATELRTQKRYNESLEQVEKHGACDKSSVRMSYHYHKGWTYYEMGDYEKAIQEFTEGLKTQKGYMYAYWRRGLAYEALGNFEAAESDYRTGYEVGLKEHGEKFFEYMEKNPSVKEKFMKN